MAAAAMVVQQIEGGRARVILGGGGDTTDQCSQVGWGIPTLECIFYMMAEGK